MKVEDKKPGWTKLEEGDRLEAGTAANFKTGDWKSERPVWDEKKCIQCLACWIHCPDTAVKIENGKVTGFNYDHCKGCGICAAMCPPKVTAIKMEKEKK